MRILVLSLISLILALWLFSANGEDNFLTPEAAFPLTVEASAQTLRVQFDIQAGYYLYQDKISVVSQDLVLEKPILPAAIRKNDPFFGEVAIYQKPLTFDVPIREIKTTEAQAKVTVEYQGCSEAGLCYPPQQVDVRVPLAAISFVKAAPTENLALQTPETTAPNPTPVSQLLGIAEKASSQNFGLQGDDLLAPEVAFVPQLIAEKTGQLAIFWQVQPGYYLYQKALEVQSEAKTLKVNWEAAQEQEDPFFGHVLVYKNDFSGKIMDDFSGNSLSVAFQGCSEVFGVCYPTVTKTLPVSAAEKTAHTAFLATLPATASPETHTITQNTTALSETETFGQGLAEKSFLINVLIFFGLGLLLAFTPCVFPMIPILSGIIAGQRQLSAWRGFSLSLVYVLGMAFVYTTLGIAMALLGAEANLQAALQNPWVLGFFAFIFLLLALSMFGFYDLQLPPSWQAALSNTSNRLAGGQYLGVAIMGMLSALIVGPCMAAPLAGILLYISQSGDVWLGGSALFAMSLGMGLPLLVIGASAGHWLPKAGAWMNATKAVFGVLLLGVGIWLIGRVLPQDLTLLLWAALFLGSGVYLGAFAHAPSGWQKLRKTLGLAAIIFALSLFLGAASGGQRFWPPLAHWQNPTTSLAKEKLAFQAIASPKALDLALRNSQGQKTMLNFTADWCIACKELEAITFQDSQVQAALADYRLLQVDLTQQNTENLALLKQFSLFGPPALLFFDGQGQELRAQRLIGFVAPEKFLRNLP